MNENDLTPCYNCTGERTLYICGAPRYGCEVCKNYGNSNGKIFKQFRHQKVLITCKDGVIKEFNPPIYECTTCKDTLKASYRLTIDKYKDPICSDYGWHKMPIVELPCDKCRKIEHVEKKKIKQANLNL